VERGEACLRQNNGVAEKKGDFLSICCFFKHLLRYWVKKTLDFTGFGLGMSYA